MSRRDLVHLLMCGREEAMIEKVANNCVQVREGPGVSEASLILSSSGPGLITGSGKGDADGDGFGFRLWVARADLPATSLGPRF